MTADRIFALYLVWSAAVIAPLVRNQSTFP